MTAPAIFKPGKRAFIVGVTGLMAKYDVGEHKAKKWLREWYEAQQDGASCPRVFRERARAGYAYFTTEAELNAHNPRTRDQSLVRQVQRLETELDAEKRRVDKLLGEVAALKTRMQRAAR